MAKGRRNQTAIRKAITEVAERYHGDDRPDRPMTKSFKFVLGAALVAGTLALGVGAYAPDRQNTRPRKAARRKDLRPIIRA